MAAWHVNGSTSWAIINMLLDILLTVYHRNRGAIVTGVHGTYERHRVKIVTG